MEIVISILANILIESFNYFLQVWYWITLGFILGGLVTEFVPREWIMRHIGGRDLKSLVKASVLGVSCDVCSHGVLPLAVALFEGGASRAATIAFLVATPWIGVMETLILYSFVGLRMTLIMSVLSVVVAFLASLVIAQLEKRKLIETWRRKGTLHKLCCHPSEHHKHSTLYARIWSALHYSWDLARMIGKWFLIGFLGAGIVKVLVPAHLVHAYLGYAVFSVPLALVLASLIEVCSEGSIPIIGAFYRMGASPGSVFVMLMGGVATDLTEIGTLWTAMGKRTAMSTLLVLIGLSLFFGFLLNLIL
jgi:hypothetical protein